MEKSEDYKKKGTEAYNNKKYKEAIDLYTEAIGSIICTTNDFLISNSIINIIYINYRYMSILKPYLL